MATVPDSKDVELVSVGEHTYLAVVGGDEKTGYVLSSALSVTNPPSRRSASAFVDRAFLGESLTLKVGNGRTMIRRALTPEEASWIDQARLTLGFAEKSAVPRLITGEAARYRQ